MSEKTEVTDAERQTTERHQPEAQQAEAGKSVSGEPGRQQTEAVEAAAPPSGHDPDLKQLEEKIIEVLKTVYDPEIPVNIWELGLVYNLDVAPLGIVNIQMTLTSPSCPVAESLPPEVEAKVRSTSGVTDVNLELVWDPPWSMDKMSEAARLQLGLL